MAIVLFIRLGLLQSQEGQLSRAVKRLNTRESVR